MWDEIKDIAWVIQGNTPAALRPDLSALLPIYLKHGLLVKVGFVEVFPPICKCMGQCNQNPVYRDANARPAPDLADAKTHKATFFTRAYGPVPGYTTSTYCRGCLTHYHHNCYVSNGICTYYDHDIDPNFKFVQIATHFFIEHELCKRFATQMAMAWTSSQNCACIYNQEVQAYPWAIDLPQDWPITFDLHYELVSDAFYIHALLEWHHNHQTHLQVPHKATNPRVTFHEAIEARNHALAGPGQPKWNHACSRCMHHIKDENGRITSVYRSAVTDGISLGHPCCAMHNCKVPLANNQDRYCPNHSGMRDECAVEGCTALAEHPFHTCKIPNHRMAEERYFEHGKVMFQLKNRLTKASRQPSDITNLPLPLQAPQLRQDDDIQGTTCDGDVPILEDEVAVDENGEVLLEGCDKKPTGGHRKVFARFGRCRTHNDELCVASCGIILGRATFYGAEGPNSVCLFWKALFPTPSSVPNVMWYDNNCGMLQMLQKDEDHYFDHIAKPIDVFHFKSQHTIDEDSYCSSHCNPAQWGELMDEKTGQWIFNLSAAEQCNTWYGGFHAITRVMRADRFCFFLDEMTMHRNRWTKAQLRAAGCAPYSIPHEDLLYGNKDL